MPAGGYSGGFHPSSLTLHDVRMERTHSHGALINGATATVGDTAIVGTHDINGIFGDGVTVVSDADIASLDVSRSHIVDSERAGVANFGGVVTLAATSLSCNAIQLASQQHEGSMPSFNDAGENVCRCDEELQTCKVVAAGLELPGAVEASAP